MGSTPQARLKRDVLSGSEGRHMPLHILFVHSHVAEVERCLQELNKMHFTVSAEIVGTPEEFSERLGSHAYDLVVAEYPSPDSRETQPSPKPLEAFRSTLPLPGRKSQLRNLPLRPPRQISRSERGHGENARLCLKRGTVGCKPCE